MKRQFLIAWMALIFCFICIESGAADVDVRVAPHSVIHQISSSVVTVTVRNTGAEAVYIPKSLSPFYTPGNHLMAKLFIVADTRGKEVPFIGRMVRVAPRDPDTFFFKVEVGQSLSQDVDLSTDYDLSPGGTFQVSYQQGYTKTIHMDERNEIDSPFDYQGSAPAILWVSPTTPIEP